MMAARLEAEVCQRERSKFPKNSSKSYDKSDVSEDACVFVDCLHAPAVESSEQVVKSYKDLFFHLNLAIHNEDDVAKRFHNLKHAKSLADKLVNRQHLFHACARNL